MEKLFDNVLAYAQKHGLFSAGDRVGVAVSGGADSVGLLRLLLGLRESLAVVISVVHFNHNLRAESTDDEAFVRELARLHGTDFFGGSGDVGGYARQNRLGVEAAARFMRYQYFQSLFESHALDRIATAHTMEDQAETVLLKLSRGAGTRGLAGIYPGVESGRGGTDGASAPSRCTVRPLLSTRRAEIRQYLANVGQSWREDGSNRDLRHARNRVRHGILPRLERHVNPGVVYALADAAEIARAEERYWQDEVSGILPAIWERDSRDDEATSCGNLDNASLGKLPLALRRRVVRAVGQIIGQALEFRHVEAILELSRAPLRTGKVTLPGDWKVSRDRRGLRFQRLPHGNSVESYEYKLGVPGQVIVPEIAKMFEAVLMPAPGSNTENQNYHFDISLPVSDLRVRNWRAGDRFWPVHRKNPKKIKELLQEQQVTGEERKLWPVITSGAEVIWVRGFDGPRRTLAGERGDAELVIQEHALKQGHQAPEPE